MIYCEAGKFIIAFAFTKPVVGGYVKPAEIGKSVHVPAGDRSECIMGATRLLMTDDMYKNKFKN